MPVSNEAYEAMRQHYEKQIHELKFKRCDIKYVIDSTNKILQIREIIHSSEGLVIKVQ